MSKETIFISKAGSYQILYKYEIREKINGRPHIREPKFIKFGNHIYSTANSEEIDFLKSNDRYGKDYSIMIGDRKPVIEKKVEDVPASSIVGKILKERKEKKNEKKEKDTDNSGTDS